MSIILQRRVTPRFSVHFALILMTAVAVGLTFYRIELNRPAGKQAALTWIFEHRGDHETCGLDDTRLIAIGGNEFGDEESAMLAYFYETGWLNIWGAPASDEAFVHIGKMRNLDKLVIEGCRFNGEGLKYLTHLPKLNTLWIEYTPIDDRAIPHLLQMKGLRSLCITDSRLSEQGIRLLKRRLKVPDLNLSGGYDAEVMGGTDKWSQ